jgi:hypothetical protein
MKRKFKQWWWTIPSISTITSYLKSHNTKRGTTTYDVENPGNWFGTATNMDRVMVFNATFNNISVISWQSVFLVEETRIQWGKNHWPAASHWQTLYIMLYRVHLTWAGIRLTTCYQLRLHLIFYINVSSLKNVCKVSTVEFSSNLLKTY